MAKFNLRKKWQKIIWGLYGRNARKPVFEGLQTIQVQTSLRIRADWSASLLFAFWKASYVNLLQMKFKISS